MSSYLEIAATVLAEERRPLTARAMLRIAYSKGYVPPHLHGRTQHKTLQARLSEDILGRGKKSAFFRTEPGKFFLRSFITDCSVPVKFRAEMTAPRRRRTLFRGRALAMHAARFDNVNDPKGLTFAKLRSILLEDGACYTRTLKKLNDLILIIGFATVVRDGKFLSYRAGPYRSIRDERSAKRSIGFSTLISDSDHDLFSQDEFGIIDAALRAALLDLGLEGASYGLASQEFSISHVQPFAYDLAGRAAIAVVVKLNAPEWFEPWQKRLSISDFRWVDPDVPENDPDAFDEISRRIIESCREAVN